MPEIIFDNCVLSNFALSDSMYIIKKLYADTAYITDFVIAENIKGILKGHKNLIKIKEAVKDGWLKEIFLEKTKEKELFEALLVSSGSGETSSIAVAKIRGFVFACDDSAARKEAVSLDVKITGTIGMLVKAVKKKVIERKEADVILRKMIKYGFYSPITSIRVLLFGSSLDHTRESHDIDIAVEGVPPKDFFKYYGDLLLKLSKPVDVIDLSETSKFIKLIQKEGVLLYD